MDHLSSTSITHSDRLDVNYSLGFTCKGYVRVDVLLDGLIEGVSDASSPSSV